MAAPVELVKQEIMHKSIAVLLLAACGAAMARTPANHPMPDGSRDMYVGLGLLSAPDWDGADGRKLRAQPLLQVQWSNGIFISGMRAGLHLSDHASVEYGPLLGLQPRRSQAGSHEWVGAPAANLSPSRDTGPEEGRLVGMEPVPARLEAGVFYNHYLSERVRINNAVLYGAGRERDGLRYTLDVQTLAADLSSRHKISALVGLTLVNRAHNAAYFGVSEREASSARPPYAPGGGLRDIHASVLWNYALTPAWMLATQVQVTQLRGDAARSPLVQRSTNVNLSTGLAYRF